MMDFNSMLKLVDLNTILASFCWLTVGIFSVGQKFAPQGKKPWSILLSFIGREINAEIIQSQKEMSDRINALDKKLECIQVDLSNRIDSLDEKIETTDQKLDKNVAISSRVRILRFGDELSERRVHGRESFTQVFEDIKTYDTYCETHKDFKNHMTASTTKIIIDTYDERLRKNDFTH